MRRLLAVLTSSLVIGLGLVTLWGLFPGSPVASITAALLQMVVVIGAVAVLIGVLNLLGVHLRRIVKGDSGWPYSVVVLLAAVAVILLVVVDRMGLGGESDLGGFLFNAVQVSVESA